MPKQRTIWLAAAAAVTVLCAAGAATEILRDYRTTRSNIESETAATVRLAEVHADRALSFLREAFDRLAPFIAATDRDSPDSIADLRDRFQDMAVASESIGTLWIVDGEGRRWLNSQSSDPLPATGRLSEYLTEAINNPDVFTVGPVSSGRVVTRDRFTISRGVRDGSGKLIGVLNAGVDVDYFSRIYANVRTAPNVQLVAFDRRGRVLAPSPSASEETIEVARRALTPDANSVKDDRWTLAVTQFRSFPIVIAAVTDLDQALGNWKRRSWQVGLLSGLMSIGFALLTAAGIRSARREEETAHNLRQLNEHLEVRVRERTASLDLLLRELNHRVKNNLQIIGSLIRLQSRSERDPKVIAILEKTNRRIFAVADLHCELETADSGCASSKDFFERIVRRIVEASEAPGRRIELLFAIDDTPLTVDRAVPLGLILNETVTNCFKHAFVDRIRGQIEVTFTVDGDVAVLIVRDDGVSKAAGSAGGLGSRIIAMLAQQIHGTVTIDDRNGRAIRIIAPLANPTRVAALPRAAE